jgi:hypothetical protein
MTNMTPYYYYEENNNEQFCAMVIVALFVVVCGQVAFSKASEIMKELDDEELVTMDDLYAVIKEQDEEIEALKKKVKLYQELACQMLDRKVGINDTTS